MSIAQTETIAEIRDVQDRLYDLVTRQLSARPAAHNVRRMRRDAQEASALAEQLADLVCKVDPATMRMRGTPTDE